MIIYFKIYDDVYLNRERRKCVRKLRFSKMKSKFCVPKLIQRTGMNEWIKSIHNSLLCFYNFFNISCSHQAFPNIEHWTVKYIITYDHIVLRLLQKSHLKKNNAIAIRDSLRNEVSKQNQSGEENKEKRDQKVRLKSQLCWIVMIF